MGQDTTVIDKTTTNIRPSHLDEHTSYGDLDEEEKLLQRCILRNFMERSKQTDLLELRDSSARRCDTEENDDIVSRISYESARKALKSHASSRAYPSSHRS